MDSISIVGPGIVLPSDFSGFINSFSFFFIFPFPLQSADI